MNAILYFALRIFELPASNSRSLLLTSVGVGVTNLLFTFVGLWLIDRLGRRTLLLIGSFGYIGLSSSDSARGGFYSGNSTIVPALPLRLYRRPRRRQGTVSLGPHRRDLPEPPMRRAGQSLGSFTHWIFAALVATFFPGRRHSSRARRIFAFATGMMVLQLAWVLLLVPETNGVPLEECHGGWALSRRSA